MLFKSHLFVHKTHLGRMNKDWDGEGEERRKPLLNLGAGGFTKTQPLTAAAPPPTQGWMWGHTGPGAVMLVDGL